MYTVDDILDLLRKGEFNIKRKDGLHRVSGYTATIDCEDRGNKVTGVPIGVHKIGKYWTVTDLHTGLAITATDVHTKRSDAIGAFLMKYPAYSRLCISRERDGMEW